MTVGAIVGASWAADGTQADGFRRDGTGLYPDAHPPTAWRQERDGVGYRTTNIAWKTRLPFEGASSPICVDGRVIVTGCGNNDGEAFDVLCLDAGSGVPLWLRTLTYYDTLTLDGKAALKQVKAPDSTNTVDALMGPLVERFGQINAALFDQLRTNRASVASPLYPNQVSLGSWDFLQERKAVAAKINRLLAAADPVRFAGQGRNDFGWASPTPCTDGRFVYVYFSSRLAACYDLQGLARWVTLQPERRQSNTEHGTHGSPLLADGKFIIPYAGTILGLDATAGGLVWTQAIQYTWGIGYSSLVTGRVGNATVAICAHGQAVDTRTGALAWSRVKEYAGENTTALVSGDRVFMYERTGIRAFRMPAAFGGTNAALTNVAWYNPKNQPRDEAVTNGVALHFKPGSVVNYQIASPLFVEGLLYCVNDQGVLSVFDPQANAMVYKRVLPFRTVYPGVSASPVFAGGHIYISDNQGITVVLKPGRAYEEVACNAIDAVRDKEGHFESFLASPCFSGNTVYIRGGDYMYAVR